MKNLISANEELNKWCGTEGINFYEGDTALGFLFKYPVPKLCQEYIELEIHLDYLVKSDSWNMALLDGFYDQKDSKYLIAVKNNKDSALALFWAIKEAIKEEKDDNSERSQGKSTGSPTRFKKG